METTGREKTEMKIKTERVIIVTFLIVMLIIPAFCTADAPLPIRLLTGEAPESMRIVLSAPEVRKMSQFDDARTAQLNRLIRHLALDVTLGRDVSRTGILIDQQEILSWIQKESGNWFNSFIIDKGSDDGIKVDMNVLSGGGLCGIVTEVGKNYAKVLSIIDDDSNISAMSAKTKDTFIVAGDLQLYDEGLLSIQYADKDAEFADGDMVITSNISTKYLPGLLIGYIHEIRLDANNLTKSGYLLPEADFDDLTRVLVITMVKDDLMIDMPEKLENESSVAESEDEAEVDETTGGA